MPPPISEDDSSVSSDVEMSESEVKPTPKATPKASGKAKGRPKVAPQVEEPEEEEEDEEQLKVESDDDEDDDLEPDEYVVEQIRNHIVDAETGGLIFEVKWEGYEKASDRTWEPEANLMETATEIVLSYLETKGGREAILEEFNAKKAEAAPKRKRGRQSNGTASKKVKKETPNPGSTSPPASLKEEQFVPPKGNWEDEVTGIDACEGGEGKVVVYLTWKNGSKSQHPLQQVYKRCPQRMLKFYESHLVFKKTEPTDS